jgi:hypothetical protein
MKKISYLGLLFLVVAFLGSCGNTSSNSSETILTPISGEELSSDEGTLILASATKNVPSLSKMSMTENSLSDDSTIYKGSLSSLSRYDLSILSGSFDSYSNHMLEESEIENSTNKNGDGLSVSIYENEFVKEWAGNPIDSSLGDVYSLFEQSGSLNSEGAVETESCLVESPAFSLTKKIDATWQRFLTDSLSDICKITESIEYLQINDDQFVAIASAATDSTLSNPLYPNDSSKDIGTRLLSQTIYYFQKDSAGEFWLERVQAEKKKLVFCDFSFNFFSSPTAIESFTEEINLTYGDKIEGEIPTDLSVGKAPILVLESQTPSGFYPASTGSVYFSDATGSYKLINPSFSGYAYEEILNLSSPMEYSLTTMENTTANPPVYDEWGYSDVDASSIKFDTITDAKVTGENFFLAQTGMYQVKILLGEDKTLKYFGVTYLGLAIIF